MGETTSATIAQCFFALSVIVWLSEELSRTNLVMDVVCAGESYVLFA